MTDAVEAAILMDRCFFVYPDVSLCHGKRRQAELGGVSPGGKGKQVL